MTGGTDAFLLLPQGSSEQGETQQRHVGADDNRMNVANMIAGLGLDYTKPPLVGLPVCLSHPPFSPSVFRCSSVLSFK